jgi:hypothetical protein
MPIRKTGGCQTITPPIPFRQMNRKGNHGPIAKQAGKTGIGSTQMAELKRKK